MNPTFRQVGNAVPPLMAKALATEMVAALRAARGGQDSHVDRRAAAAV